MSYATAARGSGQRQQAGGAARSSAKPPWQKTAEKPQAVERQVYRRRDRTVVEQLASGRPPDLEAHAESSGPVGAVEEQPQEIPREEVVLHVDTVVRECPGDSAEILSPVPLAVEQGAAFLSSVVSEVADSLVPTGVGVPSLMIPPGFIRAVSPPSHFSSESDVPLSQWLPSHFFSVGPWRSPVARLRDGPLQIQMGFLQYSSRGGAIFQGSASSPFFRVMFETRHDREWDLGSVYDSFYDQAFLLAENYIGTLAPSLFSGQFDSAIGQLYWSESGSFWCIPLVFTLEDDTVLPQSFQRWDARTTSTFLGIRARLVTEWFRTILEGRHHGFRVPWEG